MSDRGNSQERDTRFAGYGDRVGSGVELTSAKWSGGELITDPTFVTKSLKPKRFYYSPIGDGVVAADGIELKYGPKNLEPHVTVIQQRTVERTKPGQAGVRVIEKVWSDGGGSQEDNVNKQIITTTVPFGGNNNLTNNEKPHNNNNYSLNAGNQTPYKSPVPTPSINLTSNAPIVKPLTHADNNTNNYYVPINTTPLNVNIELPHTGNYNSAAPNLNSSFSSLIGNDRSYNNTPNSTKTSSSLYEPGMRYEIKRDYLISNPRELIHQYATTTPIDTISGGETTTTKITKQSYHSTVEETCIGPLPPYQAGSNCQSPNKFVRQLRDDTMTNSQRQANQNVQSLVLQNNIDADQKIKEVQRQNSYFTSNSEIDSLTNRLVSVLNSQPK